MREVLQPCLSNPQKDRSNRMEHGVGEAQSHTFFLLVPTRKVVQLALLLAVQSVPFIVQPESAISAVEQRQPTISGSPGKVNHIVDDTEAS